MGFDGGTARLAVFSEFVPSLHTIGSWALSWRLRLSIPRGKRRGWQLQLAAFVIFSWKRGPGSSLATGFARQDAPAIPPVGCRSMEQPLLLLPWPQPRTPILVRMTDQKSVVVPSPLELPSIRSGQSAAVMGQ